MADTNGEIRRETLEERQARQEGASRDTAAAIEAKDESIAAKKAESPKAFCFFIHIQF